MVEPVPLSEHPETPEKSRGPRVDGFGAEDIREQLRGDLDNIVLMALRKDPRQRYGSVEQLAADIERHLGNLPVRASGDTFAYRASKFVRRHRAAAIATIAFGAALLAGLTTTFYEARRARQHEQQAEQRFNQLRKLANSMLFEIHDSIRDLPGSTNARKLLVDRALQYLDSLSTESANDPSLSRELAFAYERVGDVQGYFYSSNLGDTSAALKSYRKALAIREMLAKRNPKDPAAQSELASSYTRIGDTLYSIGDKAGALQQARQVLEIRKTLAKDSPSEDARFQLADGHRALGDELIGIPDWPEAKQQYEESLREFEQVDAASPQSPRTRRMIAILHDKLGFVEERTGDFTAAARDYGQARDILSELAAADATNATLQRNLALAYLNTGDIALAQGNPRGIEDLRKAARIAETIAAADPSNRRIERDIALVYAHLGDAERKNSQMQLALRYYTRALDAAKRRAEADPHDMDAAESVANRYQSLGALYVIIAAKEPRTSQTNWHKALNCLQKSLAFWLDPKRAGPLTDSEKQTVAEIQRMLRQCELRLKLSARA